MNCLRASSVVELIQASPPGQPRTFGGAKRSCPRLRTVKASGSASGTETSSVRRLPTTRSTGDLTSAPRFSDAQKARVSSSARRACRMSSPEDRKRSATRLSSAVSAGDAAAGDTNSRHSLPAMNSAVAGCASRMSSTSSPSKLPLRPSTRFSPVSCIGARPKLPVSRSRLQPVKARAASLMSCSP